MKCTKPDIGKLITRYEFDLVSDDERRIFAGHLLECDACLEDLYSMSQVVGTMKENAEQFIAALKRSIEESERKRQKQSILHRLQEIASDAVHDIASFGASLVLEHRAAFVMAVAIMAIICSIVIWRSNFLKPQPPQLAQHPAETVDSARLKEPADSMRNRQLQPSPLLSYDTARRTYPPSSTFADLSAYAVIEHSDYAYPASRREESELTQRLFDTGMSYYQKKDYRMAVEYLDQVVEGNSSNAEAQFYLGISYLLLTDLDRGIEHLRHPSVLSDRELPEKAHWYLGNAYLRKNDGVSALREFQLAMQLRGECRTKAEELVREIRRRESK